ncbi:transposase [Alteromonas sp. K632G]|uniref:Transposase n=2 Tax=Alteromonadales TaxID=135622 RepID=A0ABS0WAD3_9ALTE|nr:transposase [Paraglaciecola chathamensis]MBO7921088.1 transposase [Alteromonas sp. K632G]
MARGHRSAHMFFGPLVFVTKLATLVPQRRLNLTRSHGVFAHNSRVRDVCEFEC